MMNFLNQLLIAAEPTEAAEALTEAAETANLVFSPGSFVENLQYMGIGMLVIFIVISVIILSTKLINYLFSDNTAE